MEKPRFYAHVKAKSYPPAQAQLPDTGQGPCGGQSRRGQGVGSSWGARGPHIS